MRSLAILLVNLCLFTGAIWAAQPSPAINNQQLVNLLMELLKKQPAAQQQQVNAPAPVYRKLSYSNPTSYDAPTSYSAPAPALSEPVAAYSAPAPSYSAPAAPVLSQPAQSYAAPAQSYSAPVQVQRQTAVQPAYGANNLVSLDEQTPSDPCSPNPCMNEGVCTVTGNGPVCACPWGWTGSRCEKCLTDCASSPCPATKRCKARFGGGFDCICPSDRKGANCELANDACDVNRCQNGATCKLEVGGSYSCICAQPFDGAYCERAWQNPCSEETLRSNDIVQFRNPWDRNSYLVCYDVLKFHAMPCPAGTYFNANLNHCVPEGYDPPVCPANYCYNDGECIIDDQNALRCACKRGFTGDKCEIDIDDCTAAGGHDACGAGNYCVDQINGYYCQCQNGGVGLDCQNVMANPCTADNVANERNYFDFPSPNGDAYLHCTGVGQFSVRRCPDLLFWNQDEQTCTMERPLRRLGAGTGPCSNTPCKNGATCSEASAGTFACACKAGYTGDTCEIMIDYCASNPCQNGGRCLGYAGGYTCVCPDKVIDECCCNGVTNPCPPKSKLVPGINNYFEHLFPHRYIHCDFEGRAFVRNCAPGLRWYQDALACLSDQHVKTFLASQQYNAGPAYGTVAPVVEAPLKQTSSYGSSYSAPAPVQVTASVQSSYSAPAQPSYSAPAPVQVAAPVQSSYSAPAPVQSSYSAPAPVQVAAPVQSSYSAPAPVQLVAPTQSSYSAPAPVQVAAPVQSSYSAPAQPSYSAPAPVQVSAPVQSSYSAPAQSSYSAPAPVQVAAPVQSSYAAPVSAAPSAYGSMSAQSTTVKAQSSYGVPPQLSVVQTPSYGGSALPAAVKQVVSSSSYGSTSSQSTTSNNYQQSQSTSVGGSSNNNFQSSIMAIAQQLNMSPQQVMQMFQGAPVNMNDLAGSGQQVADASMMMSGEGEAKTLSANSYKRKFGKRL